MPVRQGRHRVNVYATPSNNICGKNQATQMGKEPEYRSKPKEEGSKGVNDINCLSTGHDGQNQTVGERTKTDVILDIIEDLLNIAKIIVDFIQLLNCMDV